MSTSKNTRNEAAVIKIQNKTLVETSTGKLLGITIDKNINMKEHIKKHL